MKVYMETMGCPKNYKDSQVAKGLIQEKGFQITDNIDDCDVMILNTCGFINDAKKESISRTFELAEYKNDGKKLIMTGCLSERYSKDLFEEMPEVDCFLGVNEYDKLPDILENIMKSHI